jgi:hypothetical protein
MGDLSQYPYFSYESKTWFKLESSADHYSIDSIELLDSADHYSIDSIELLDSA